VLCFRPTHPRKYREVCAWFRETGPEDIAKQICFFLELVRFCRRGKPRGNSPIAVSRKPAHTRPASWEEKRTTGPTLRARRRQDRDGRQRTSNRRDFESVSVLNDFLDYCSAGTPLPIRARNFLIKSGGGFTAKRFKIVTPLLSEHAYTLRVQNS